MRTEPITDFRGEFEFLSNFHINVFEWRQKQWFCGEQAFQYAKTFYPKNSMERQRCEDLGKRLRDTGNPGVAKKYGRQVPLNVVEWDKNKVQYMREIVHARFLTSRRDMVGPLINTGAAMLVEGNDWNDTFWGRCNGRGRNVLGAILMEERGWWSREGKP